MISGKRTVVGLNSGKQIIQQDKAYCTEGATLLEETLRLNTEQKAILLSAFFVAKFCYFNTSVACHI